MAGIILNGKPSSVKEKTTLTEFVSSLNINSDYIVAEINGELMEKKEWNTRVLKENDKIELIRFVGGGSAQYLL